VGRLSLRAWLLHPDKKTKTAGVNARDAFSTQFQPFDLTTDERRAAVPQPKQDKFFEPQKTQTDTDLQSQNQFILTTDCTD
jgi:putative SOS response-associated peptidase YedK